jgi:hypothetical protein
MSEIIREIAVIVIPLFCGICALLWPRKIQKMWLSQVGERNLLKKYYESDIYILQIRIGGILGIMMGLFFLVGILFF